MFGAGGVHVKIEGEHAEGRGDKCNLYLLEMN